MWYNTMETEERINKILADVWPEWILCDKIGHGQYGKVYRIERHEDGKCIDTAALKVVEIPDDQSEIRNMQMSNMDEQTIRNYLKETVDSFKSEVNIMQSLKDTDNIVSIRDFHIAEKEDEIGWIILIRMELLDNLGTYMESRKMTAKDYVKIGIDVCDALSSCEKLKIIHRDIKPENIFVDREGSYKLGDFGIARQLEATRSAMSMRGSELYMAPEVIRKEKYDSTVDIYSLGIMLYRFLNKGRMPFYPEYPKTITRKSTEEALIRKNRGETFPKPADADDRLSSIIIKACSYEPKNRYQTAENMKKDLISYLEGTLESKDPKAEQKEKTDSSSDDDKAQSKETAEESAKTEKGSNNTSKDTQQNRADGQYSTSYYEDSIKLLNSTDDLNTLYRLRDYFSSLRGYRDLDKMLERCNTRISDIERAGNSQFNNTFSSDNNTTYRFGVNGNGYTAEPNTDRKRSGNNAVTIIVSILLCGFIIFGLFSSKFGGISGLLSSLRGNKLPEIKYDFLDCDSYAKAKRFIQKNDMKMYDSDDTVWGEVNGSENDYSYTIEYWDSPFATSIRIFVEADDGDYKESVYDSFIEEITKHYEKSGYETDENMYYTSFIKGDEEIYMFVYDINISLSVFKEDPPAGEETRSGYNGSTNGYYYDSDHNISLSLTVRFENDVIADIQTSFADEYSSMCQELERQMISNNSINVQYEAGSENEYYVARSYVMAVVNAIESVDLDPYDYGYSSNVLSGITYSDDSFEEYIAKYTGTSKINQVSNNYYYGFSEDQINTQASEIYGTLEHLYAYMQGDEDRCFSILRDRGYSGNKEYSTFMFYNNEMDGINNIAIIDSFSFQQHMESNFYDLNYDAVNYIEYYLESIGAQYFGNSFIRTEGKGGDMIQCTDAYYSRDNNYFIEVAMYKSETGGGVDIVIYDLQKING